MGKTIKVCVRTRPTAQFAAGHIAIDADRNAITIDKGHEASPDGVCNNAQSRFDFRFHHVLHNASQDTVYETLARDVVQDVVDGINGTIMTYGQTGSGKTFTMLGDMNNYVHRGVAPRALAHVFADVAARIETQYTVVCTYMEIYNERIFDLLKALGDEDARNDYQIVEEKGGRGVFVRGLTEVEVASEAEALNLLYSGQLARTTAQHKLNRNSNRSHSIFTVTLRQQSRSGVSEKVVTSKLNLVDLAGSERLKKTMEGADGTAYDVDATMKKESMYINQSLTYLEQCVVGLSKRAPQHVAYRQTKLTGVLKDSLGGNCATLLFACMWAESAHLEETVSTLRLAQRMMRVQNTAEKVQTTDPARLARKQERLIRDLRQELLMHDALADRSGVKYDPYTPEEQAIIAAQCRRYADADEARAADLLEFDSVRQMREMCAQFKKLLRDAEAKAVRARTAMTSAGGVPTGLFAGDEVGMGEDGGDAEAAGVGDAEAGRGLSLGRAPDASRPLVVVDARSPERASLAERSVGLGAERRGKINRTFAAPSHRGAACGRRVARSCAAGASLVSSKAAAALRPSEEKPRPSAVPRRRRVAVRRRVLGRTRGEPPVQNGRRGHRQRPQPRVRALQAPGGTRDARKAPARQARAVRRQVPNPRRRGPRGRGEARHRGRRRKARGDAPAPPREDPGGGARRRRRRRRGGVRLDARGPRREAGLPGRARRVARGAARPRGGGAGRRRDEGPTRRRLPAVLRAAAAARRPGGGGGPRRQARRPGGLRQARDGARCRPGPRCARVLPGAEDAARDRHAESVAPPAAPPQQADVGPPPSPKLPFAILTVTEQGAMLLLQVLVGLRPAVPSLPVRFSTSSLKTF